MDQVKTYSKVNRKNPSLTFGISKIETIFEQRKGVPIYLIGMIITLLF